MLNCLMQAYDQAMHGKIQKAIRCCKKLLKSQEKLTHQQQKEVLYFLAYLHLMSEHEARHSQWSVLGVDLRRPYFHAYHKAMHYLDLLDDEFDPSAHDMPAISEHDRHMLREFSNIAHGGVH
ncbi:MAG: hypothetical protein CMF39_00635 [Legionellaceae bacterium]|nr:hypothetical protein [Legionellaceae bacterium]